MSTAPIRVLGRYALFSEIAAGGMATVHLGRLLGPVGFSRTVAIKRLHAQLAKDPDFVSMLVDEARVAARIQHPNVVQTLDVVAAEGELFLVMEYVAGESLARILRSLQATGERIPHRIVGSIMTNVLYGLHAAHEARSERGEPLGIIHRDVSPQNVLVGLDGVARVLDFGVAKAAGRVQSTREGEVKGKLAYMPVEQIAGDAVDRRADVYAAAVVVWEALTGRRLFEGPNDPAVMHRVMTETIVPPSQLVPGLAPGVDEVVLRGLARQVHERYASAFEMAVALEETLGLETPRQVGAFVERAARETLSRRAELVKEIESRSTDLAQLAPASIPVPLGSGLPRPGAPAQEDSNVSSISMAASRVPDRRSSHVLTIAGAAVALGVGAGALALVLALRQAPDAGAGRPAAPGPTAIGAEPTTELARSAPEPVVEAIPASAPAPSTSGPTVPTTRPGAARPVPKPVPKVNCKPPYVMVDGIRKLKPECL